ncbi:MAG: carboxypeptidase M32 [Candidatus Paceibacteria bacterium]
MEEERLQELKSKLSELAYLNSANTLLHWDQEVHMPDSAVDARSKASSNLSKLIHQKFTSEEFEQLVQEAKQALDQGELSDEEEAIVREVSREFKREQKLSSEFVEQLTEVTSQAQEAWKQAKQEQDFSIFQPHLEKIIKLKRKEADLVGYEDSPYDALLDTFEPYMITSELESVFSELKDFLVPFLERIQRSETEIEDGLLDQKFSIEQQKEFSTEVIQEMGFELQRGVVEESVHPFTLSLHPSDVRFTSKFKEDDLQMSILSTIHEAGHALYEQGLPAENFGTPLAEAVSVGIHESQSRIWELMVGSSSEFWQYFYPKLEEKFPEQLEDYTYQDFYKAINKVEPGLIRVKADEVTYNLHIILRFELEKALIEQEIEVEQMPELWNQKMEDYLGIEVPNDSAGVLQDIHWSLGNIGYFPTYALGTVYAAQFYSTAQEKIDNLDDKISNGDFEGFRSWLRENIHIHGKYYKPKQLAKQASGEKLNPQHFIDYLKDKYSRLYNLD